MSEANKIVNNPHEIRQRINSAISTLIAKELTVKKVVEAQSQLMEDYINNYISKMPIKEIVAQADDYSISVEKDTSGFPTWFLNLKYEDGSCYEFIQDQNFKLVYISTYTSGRIDDTYVTLTIQYKFNS